MFTTDLLHLGEGLTHEKWVYKNLYTNFSRIYYIIDGEGFYKYEGKTFILKKNHLYFFPAKKNFDLFENPNNKLFHTFIHACTNPTINELVEINLENNPFLTDVVALLRKYIPFGNSLYIINILDLLLQTAFSTDDLTSSLALQIKSYIDAHLQQKIDLDLLSTNFNYSKAQLSRIFFESYKTTPIKYYTSQRLALSLKYLQNGSSSKEVSTLLNYSCPAAFCKAFKHKYGLAPEQYLNVNAIPSKKKK